MANSTNPALASLNAMLGRQFQRYNPQGNITGVNSDVPFVNEFASGFNLANGIVNAARARRDNQRLEKDWQNYGGDLQNTLDAVNGNDATLPQRQATAQALFDMYNNDNGGTLSGMQAQQQNPYTAAAGNAPAQQGEVPQFNGFQMGQQMTGGFTPMQQPTGTFNLGQQNEGGLNYATGQPIQMGQTQTPTFNSLLGGLSTEGQYSPYKPQNNNFNINGQVDGNPFVESANGEGQHIAESGNFSPETQSLLGGITPVTQQQAAAGQPAYEQALDGRYSMANFLRTARENGMSPINAMLAYNAFAAPLEDDARQQRIESNIRTWSSPDATNEEKLQALIGLAVDSHQYDLPWDTQQKRTAADMARENLLVDAGIMPAWMSQYVNGGAESGENSTGNSIIDSVYEMKEQGYSFDRYDENGKKIGTNCLATFTEGKGLANTPYKGITWIPTAIDVAKKNGDWHPAGDGYVPKPGDIAIVPGGTTGNEPDGHAVMVNYDGGTIQNSRSGNGGKGGIWEDKQSPEEMYKGKGGVTGYISTSRYGKTTSTKPSAWGALALTPKEQARQARERRAEEREARREAREARQDAMDAVRLKMEIEKHNAKYGSGGGNGKTQGLTEAQIEKFKNAERDFTISGRKISELEGQDNLEIDSLTGKTKNPYEEEMKNWQKNLDTIYQTEYRNVDFSKVKPIDVAIDLYNRINSNEEGKYKMKVTPESLADVVSRVVASRQSSVMPNDLKDDLLKYVYNRKEREKSPNADMEYHMAEEQAAAMKDYINNDPETGKPLSKEEWLKTYRPNGKPNARKDTLYKAFREYFPDGSEKVFDLGG